MRVEIAEYFRSARSRSAVRVDQCLGVDLEMRGGLRMDVGAGTDLDDPTAGAQQKPARLVRMRGARQPQQLVFDSA